MPHSLHPRATEPLIHFIADVHLSRDNEQLAHALCAYLQGPAREAQALYILGDLFDYWLGRCDEKSPPPPYAMAGAALKALREAGCMIYFQRGNRDFLLDAKAAQSLGMTMLPPISLINYGQHQALLLHGDELCTADHRYQRYRRFIRHPFIHTLSRWTPPAGVRAVAAVLRRRSQSHKQQATPTLTDATPQAVTALFRAHPAPLMIHGHTHRPAHHTTLVDGTHHERWVLGCWQDRPNYLRWNEKGLQWIEL